MCGFVGFTGRLNHKQEYLEKMMNRIVHRGPDMSGSFIDDTIALGFRRLSIIDLSQAGYQPMQNEDGSVVAVFNGEIYNFQSLRDTLRASGHQFRSDSDTEVLVHGYEEYGDRLVERLRGMFAFVIWDKKNDSLFGARDFFGIKPFYYTRLPDGNLIFGSEIKSFLEHPGFEKKLNDRALRPYLTFQYSATEETFFSGVYKLPPAHCFTYQNGCIEIRRYWDIEFTGGYAGTLEQCAEELDAVINQSVAAHRIADVKVGTFLSGGVDSSYITASMMPDKTFSVGYEQEKFNETDYAGELSRLLGIQNYRRILTAEECMDALPTIQYHMDEPQSNPSSVPLYFLAKLASEHVTVVLSGEGADEIYAGYEWYDDTPAMKKYKKAVPLPLRRAAAAIVSRLPYFKGHDMIVKSSERPENYFIGQAVVYSPKEARDLLLPPFQSGPSPKELTAPVYGRVAGCDELVKKQYLDLNLWLPGDILLKADKMSMAHSLELRVPFLDREVMQQAQTIPSGYKINGIDTKYVLRLAANRTLPDEWANRRKMGFPVPIRYWFREKRYYEYARAYFESDDARTFFHTGNLIGLLDRHYAGTENNGRKIWTALIFLVWYKRFFRDEV